MRRSYWKFLHTASSLQASPSTARMARIFRSSRSRERSRLSRRKYFAVSFRLLSAVFSYAVSDGRSRRARENCRVCMGGVSSPLGIAEVKLYIKSAMFARRYQYWLRVKDSVPCRNRSHAMGDPRCAIGGECSSSAFRQRACLLGRAQW